MFFLVYLNVDGVIRKHHQIRSGDSWCNPVLSSQKFSRYNHVRS